MQQQPQQTVEHGREPCPDRILDDIGGAFGMGALGGGCWHMYPGLKNSPKGYKIAGALDVSWHPTHAASSNVAGSSQSNGVTVYSTSNAQDSLKPDR